MTSDDIIFRAKLFTIKAYFSFTNNIIIVPFPVVIEDTEVVGLVVVETSTVG